MILRRILTLAVTTTLMIAGTVAVAPQAAASDDVCAGSGRYLLLVDPSGGANQALCHVQEAALQELSEEQWGVPYTADQRNRMLKWGRSASLGAMYLELLRIASKTPGARTADEATVYTWLQTTLAALRSRMAEGAYAEQIDYSQNPCGYTPPTPGASTIQCGNPDSMTALFGTPPGPTYEQFVSYGAQRALAEDFGSGQLALIAATARSTQHQLIGAAIGAVGGIGISVGLIAAATAGMTYTAMLAGSIATSATAATAAIGALGAFVAAAAASIFFVAIAVTAAVVRGVQIFDEAKIPGQLRDDIAAAKQPVDIASWVGDDSSRATLLLQAIARRINTQPPPSAPVPSGPAVDAPSFLVSSGTDDVTFTQTLRFRSPVAPDMFYTAWLDDGWWVIRDDDGDLAMSRDLVYLDHDGLTRSASWMAGIGGSGSGSGGGSGSGSGDPGFLVTTLGVKSPTAECTEANGCETTDALEIVTGPPAGTDPAGAVPRQSTATLHTGGLVFTGLPDMAAGYAVGDSFHAHVSATASYPTTMTYRWELTRHDPTGDKTTTAGGSSLDATLAFPGDYQLRVTATAASGESATHTWDLTVTGEADGQSYSGILLTQYSEADATPTDNTPGPWREGTTEGTICLQTGSTDPTDFTIQFDGEPAQTVPGATGGYACFPRPVSASKSGTHALANVSACATSGSLCWPTSMLDYENGLWVQTSPFSYTVTNEPPAATDLQQGQAGDTLSPAVPSTPAHFTVGDTVEATTTVSDAGGGPLTVHIRWSDGTSETRTDIASGTTVDVTHTYGSVAWGPVGVQIQAVDDTGEAGNLASGWFVVQPRPASFTLETEVGAAGLVTLTGQITDPDRTASILGIDWGDGSGDDLEDGPGYRYDAPFPAPLDTEATSAADLDGRFQVTHHYAGSGDYQVQAVLWNAAADYATATANVAVPNAAPVVVSDGPITVNDAGVVSLDALVGDLNAGDTLTLHADFDDGTSTGDSGYSSGTTVTLTHQFAGDGRHTITLQAEDQAGATSSPVTRCFMLTDGTVTPCADTLPASDDEVRSDPPGSVTAPGSAEQGTWITISLGEGHENETVTIYLYSTPTLLGTFVADAHGDVTLRLPTAVPAGAHTLAVFAGAALTGWAPITVTPADGGGGAGSGDAGGPGGTGGFGSGPGSGSGSGGETGSGSSSGSGTGTNAGGAGTAGSSSGDVRNAAEGDTAGAEPQSPSLAATGVRTRDLLGLALLLLAVGIALLAGGASVALLAAGRRRTRRT